MEKICGIYKFTNKINGKVYIGKSIDCETRIKAHFASARRNDCHTSVLEKSIIKYGAENFNTEIICTCCNKDELNSLEIKYICEYNSTDSNYGYNICAGGECIKIINYEKRNSINKSIKDRWKDPDYREKQRKSRFEYLKNESIDHKFERGRKISATKKGVATRYGFITPEITRAKLSAVNSNKKHIYNPSTGEHYMIDPDKVNDYLKKGFIFGAGPRNLPHSWSEKRRSNFKCSPIKGKKKVWNDEFHIKYHYE